MKAAVAADVKAVESKVGEGKISLNDKLGIVYNNQVKLLPVHSGQVRCGGVIASVSLLSCFNVSHCAGGGCSAVQLAAHLSGLDRAHRGPALRVQIRRLCGAAAVGEQTSTFRPIPSLSTVVLCS